MKAWKREEILHFINCLRKCKNLYDYDSPDYLNKKKKLNSYDYICKEMKSVSKIIEHFDVKKMIILLRNQFIKAKKAKQLNDTNSTPKLWCYEHLLFLDEYVETDTDISISGSGGSDSDDMKTDDYTPIGASSKTVVSNDPKKRNDGMKNILPMSNTSLPSRKKQIPPSLEKSSETDTQLIEFIYTCGMSFDLIESLRFRRLMQNLNSLYVIPKKRDILTTILNETFQKCEYNKTPDEKEAILLLYGIYERSTSKYVLACIQINGIKHFLQIWETDTNKTLHFVNDLLLECQNLAKTNYNANFYMIITDDPVLETVSMWNTTCQSFIVEYFSYGILDLKIVGKIRKSLTLMEKFTIDNLFEVNCPIILHIDKNWSTLRDMFRSYLKNIKNFKTFLIDNPNLRGQIDENLLKFILDADNDSLKEIHQNFKLLVEMAELLSCSQNNKPLLGEITNLWLALKVDDDHLELLENSRKRALSIYALSANYLHPKFKGQLLSPDQKRDVKEFLNGMLSEKGKTDLIEYDRSKGIFKSLKDRSILNSITFWDMAEKYHKDLAKMAKKILICPSSLFELEAALAKFIQVHGDLRSILGLSKFRKVAKIYFTLKFQENNVMATDLPLFKQ